jgi:peptidoglycan/xylan/chitin deacetylase (PgdA/CDA1 family)
MPNSVTPEAVAPTAPAGPGRRRLGPTIVAGVALFALLTTLVLLSAKSQQHLNRTHTARAAAAAAPPSAPVPSRVTPEPSPTWGPGGVPARLAGRNWVSFPTSQPEIALTFDDGNGRGLRSVLDTLKREKVPATFFFTGQFVETHHDAVHRLVAEGHRMAHHSYDHPYFTQIADWSVKREIEQGEAAIRAAGGDPRPLFRFPYGNHNNDLINKVNALGYVCVGWTVDSRGWMGSSKGITTQGIVNDITKAARPGAIVLMHAGENKSDHSTLDADALPHVIRALKAQGYRFVTMDPLLAAQG